MVFLTLAWGVHSRYMYRMKRKKEKNLSTHVSLPSNDFCKDFLKETHSEVVR